MKALSETTAERRCLVEAEADSAPPVFSEITALAFASASNSSDHLLVAASNYPAFAWNFCAIFSSAAVFSARAPLHLPRDCWSIRAASIWRASANCDLAFAFGSSKSPSTFVESRTTMFTGFASAVLPMKEQRQSRETKRECHNCGPPNLWSPAISRCHHIR